MKHKKVAGGLRLNLAAFRELEAFAQLGTDLDAGTQASLDRGRRMVEILKQPQYRPMHVVDQHQASMSDVDLEGADRVELPGAQRGHCPRGF